MADTETPSRPPTGSYAYEAQSLEGRTFRGTLDAAVISDAADQLKSLHLRVTRLEPTTKRQARLAEGDFLFVNRQLSHLTAGGLPMERGLRLIADELPRRQARAVRAIAADLEAGIPLGDAFSGRGGTFPPTYGRLLEAGVRAHNLPGVLVNLGRHIEMLQRLRAAVWRAAAYPVIVAAVLLGVLLFIWGYIMPRLNAVTGNLHMMDMYWFRPRSYGGSNSSAPDLTLLPTVAWIISYTVIALLAAGLLAVGIILLACRTAGGRRTLGPVLLRLPVVGPVVRWNSVARWCDALHLGVLAGLDLPAALDLAGASVDLRPAADDTALLANAVRSGQPLEPIGPLRVLPPTVPAALSLGIDQSDLPAAAATLAQMYQEQAEVRLAVVPQVLSPVLLLLIGLCIGLAAAAALLPLVVFLRAMTN